MQIRELLDELLTSLETGPLITAAPALRRQTPRVRAVSVLARPPHRGGAQGARRRAALLAPGQGLRHGGQGRAPRGGHADRLRQDPLLQPARAPGAGAAAGGAGALPLPHQGARAGSARRADGAVEDAARHADVHLRRRHPAGRAPLGARAGEPGPDQSRHAALGDPAASHQVGEPLPEPQVRRDRRAARLSRRLRQPSRQRAAPAQAHLPALRGDAAVHHGLRHHRQSAATWRSGSPGRRWSS